MGYYNDIIKEMERNGFIFKITNYYIMEDGCNVNSVTYSDVDSFLSFLEGWKLGHANGN